MNNLATDSDHGSQKPEKAFEERWHAYILHMERRVGDDCVLRLLSHAQP